MTEATVLLAKAIGRDADAIGAQARLGATEGWDSIAHMRLILALEERLGRQLTSDEMLGIESVSDISALL